MECASTILYGFKIKLLLTCGYLKTINKRHVAKELVALCTYYYAHVLPKFNIKCDYGNKAKSVEFDYINNTISFHATPKYDYYWYDFDEWWDSPENIMAKTVNSWNKQDLNNIIINDAEYDYIYKFKIKIQSIGTELNINDMAIGIMSNQPNKYRYYIRVNANKEYVSFNCNPFEIGLAYPGYYQYKKNMIKNE